jgi:hypothetical protein
MSEDIHIHGVVARDGTNEPIENAVVELVKVEPTNDVVDHRPIPSIRTDASGRFHFHESLDRGSTYKVQARAFGAGSLETSFTVRSDKHDVPLNINLGLALAFYDYQRGTGEGNRVHFAAVGQEVVMSVDVDASSQPVRDKISDYGWPDDWTLRVIPKALLADS